MFEGIRNQNIPNLLPLFLLSCDLTILFISGSGCGDETKWTNIYY